MPVFLFWALQKNGLDSVIKLRNMMNPTRISEAEIMAEQFIPDHVFVYVAKGAVNCYDGNKTYVLKAGENFIARKNRLARYKIEDNKDGFEPLIFCFEEAFLKNFQKRHHIVATDFNSADTFINVESTAFISSFVRSLNPYRDGQGKLNEAFEDLKYEELLLILLQNQPALAGVFFDFRAPEKINLEEFMNRNFMFNVSVGRFALLTGRSLSAFKRDFCHIFNQTPSRWLVHRRLQEAYFLIEKNDKKPSDIYLDLGFEDLSHFSFAFKKTFGHTPTELMQTTD